MRGRSQRRRRDQGNTFSLQILATPKSSAVPELKPAKRSSYRSLIRWQHRLKRERPTCTERNDRSSKVQMEAWRQWRAGEKKKLVEHNEKRIDLTPTGLLMEGDFTQNQSVMSRVENRRSGCSLPVAVDEASASSPQSGLAWRWFLFPLIEPDRRISRIRLSEKGSRVRPRKAAGPSSFADWSQTEIVSPPNHHSVECRDYW